MANSTDSTSVDRSSPSLTSSRLIQSFPRHDTVKLDEGSFVQWQQHVRLITEGYELQGFLEGTLPTPPRFVASSDGALTSNLEASLFTQQDKLLASWLLSTISPSLLFVLQLLKQHVTSGALPIGFSPPSLVLRYRESNMTCCQSRKVSYQ